MQPVRRHAFRVGAVLVVWLALGAAPAHAEWNPSKFVELLNAAEKDYVANNFAEAGAKYLELNEILMAALASGAIPEDQQPRAKETHRIILYQLGRSQQKSDNCPVALDAYTKLAAEEGVDAGLHAKIAVRLGEVHMCIAQQAMAAGDIEAASASAKAAAAQLAKAKPEKVGESLPAEKAAELEAERQVVLAEIAPIEEARLASYVSDAKATIDSGDCLAAETQLNGLAAKGVAAADVDGLRKDLDVACPKEQPTDIMAYAPFGLMGLGGALIATALILEGVNAGDVDDYESSRDACLGGDPTRCQKALDLSDDISTQRVVTGALVGVGVLAAAGGVAWWLMASGDDEAEATALFVPTVTADGAAATLLVRW